MSDDPLNKLDVINYRRSQAIQSLIDRLHVHLAKYRMRDYVCPEEKSQSLQCGCVLLGALTRELDRLELLSPRPQKPFSFLSYNLLCDSMKTIQSPIWIYRGHAQLLGGPRPTLAHKCSLQAVVAGIVNDAAATVTGLDLEETKESKSSLC
jgi:hypothetical protein